MHSFLWRSANVFSHCSPRIDVGLMLTFIVAQITRVGLRRRHCFAAVLSSDPQDK